MSSVLYDAPGPVARRREAWGSVVGVLVILVGLFFAVRYAAGRGVFQLDRWDVLWDPPKGQTAADVWRSLLVQGLGATLRAAAIAAPLALGLGLLLALWRRVPNVWLRAPAIGVVEIARGLPVLLVMLFGWLGFNMQPLSAVVFGLTLYNMAIFAEILRAGLAALPRGQAEASLAIGMTRWQTLLSIELPQAVRTMTPSLIAQLVVLLKDSSLGFIIGYVELLRVIQRNTAFFGADYTVALFVVGAGVYLAINISLSRLAIRLQRRGSRRSAGTIDKQKLTVATAMLDPTGGLDKSTGF
ncbi:MAG: amino acid ABC transporter permease [Actinomycetales bacterium]|nr:amino acid ABC transporter permease [Actinomycetales bacterium]